MNEGLTGNDLILETPCRICFGSGKDPDKAGPDCPLCDGAGHELTPLGERVVAVMRHNFGRIRSLVASERDAKAAATPPPGRMKLFIWNKDVFRNQESGLAVAIAASADEARELIAEDANIDLCPEEEPGLLAEPDEIRELDQPYAFHFYGSL